jgi:hypothetical protein
LGRAGCVAFDLVPEVEGVGEGGGESLTKKSCLSSSQLLVLEVAVAVAVAVVVLVQEQLEQQEQDEHWSLVPVAEVLELKSICTEILALCQVLLLKIDIYLPF